VATWTLTGDLGDCIGEPLLTAGKPAPRAWLIPYGTTVEGTEIAIAPVELELDADAAFSLAGIYEGGYKVEVKFYRPGSNPQMAVWSTGFFNLNANKDLSEVVDDEAYIPAIGALSIGTVTEGTADVTLTDGVLDFVLPTGGLSEAEVETLAGDLDDASALRQAFGSRLNEPISPWEPSPTFGPELWDLTNFQGGFNDTDLTPALTANGTNQNLRTRVNIGNMVNNDTSYRIKFDYDLTGVAGGSIQILMTDSGGTIYADNVTQMVATADSPQDTGKFDFDFTPRTTGGTYVEVRIDTFNFAPSGTISISNVSLKRTGHESRPMYVTKDDVGAFPVCYWQQKEGQTNKWKVAKIEWGEDGDLTYSYGQMTGFHDDAPWTKDPADAAFLRTGNGAFDPVNSQAEVGTGVNLRVGNNDQILSVWNGSDFELRGNVHDGEFNRSTPTYKVDRGAGLVAWSNVHGLDPVRRFQVSLPTEMRRSVDGTTPFANVDHTFTLFPDGVIRCDRSMEFLTDVTLFDHFEWMTSHDTAIPWIGRIGKGTDPIGEVDIHAKLTTPTTTAPGTATTGGTLPAATYSYRVAALSAQGETLASTAVTQATTGTTSTVTVNWSAVSGAIGYAIYGRTAGFERLLARVGAVTTWVDTGANIPDTLRAPLTVSTARTGAVAMDNEISADATWAVTLEPTSGWCHGNIFDRESVLNRAEVSVCRTRLEAASGVVKNYINTFWSNDDDTIVVPDGTIWTATHYCMVYLPHDPVNYHREIAVRASNLGALGDLYPIT
jgi:hypothetical protein